ncbi:sigma-70 family RNA polymerase sigma factor [Achromobacter aloeverae]
MTFPLSAHPLVTDDALRRRLIALARRWLAHGAEAEDLVHDAYLRAADAELPPAGSGREAWLVTVLHHLCIDFLRRQGRYKALLAQAAEETGHALDGDSPRHQVDRALRVEAALAHLSRTLAPGDAAVVMLYEIFEFTHAELGALAGRSEDASRQHLHRLLRRLRATPPAPRRVEDDEDEDAVYLFALCRHALAQRDPGGLIAVLRASTPQAIASLANAVPGGWASTPAMAVADSLHQNSLPQGCLLQGN